MTDGISKDKVREGGLEMGDSRGECILEMRDITVEFPGVLALNKARFDARRGEVHVCFWARMEPENRPS